MKVEVLGNAQDGGVPHLGCECELCEQAREKPEEAKKIASLLLEEGDGENSNARYLIDATPDLRYQITGKYIDGVFLSHEGLGHMTGLLFLGKESHNYEGIPVYTSEKANEFLQKNDPYRLLKDRGNIDVYEIEDGDEQNLMNGCIEIMETEHPRVNTNNFCFMIHGKEKKLFYVSDVHEWSHEIKQKVKEADIAILDGTFWSADEIDRYSEVSHPTITNTMAEMEDVNTEIYFTHLNHTNPAYREDSEERGELEKRGFEIAEQGMEFKI
ncbi:MAG: pyrroloquinoline quinone biosynthesis protein PqqB [Nanohaloarchaea archaeon SW_7_43_1]|nr:MAG: pyrroloquinoline quinone biosynthesis protein PqqB [Nanohaloarchaea archaeon SW_7_43_1]